MLGAPLLLALSVVVDAAGPCPSAAQIKAQLDALAPPSPREPAGPEASVRRVRVTREGGLLRLSLREPDGSEWAARDLPAGGACVDLAAAAAVVISAWLADLPGGDTPRDIRWSPPPAPLPLPLMPPPWEVSATAQLALGPEGGPVAAGTVSAALGPAARRGAALLSLFCADLRRLVVADGEAEWTRCGAGLGGQLLLTPRPRLRRTPTRPARLDLRVRAQGLLAGVFARGRGFLHNQEGTSLDVGLLAGARLGLSLRGLTPYLDLAVAGWLRPQVLLVAGQAAARELPRVDALLGLGVAFGHAP